MREKDRKTETGEEKNWERDEFSEWKTPWDMLTADLASAAENREEMYDAADWYETRREWGS